MNTKDLLLKYAHYNSWAHKRLNVLINNLPNEKHHEPIASSFNSLYKTVLHIWSAEMLWFIRLSQQPGTVTGDPFKGSMKDLTEALELADIQWIKWVESRGATQWNETLHYTNKAGQPFQQPYDLLLQHIFNHNTYHNGQIVTILRALGIERIPMTDFAAFINNI